MLKRIVYIIFALLLPVCLSSCRDELLYNPYDVPEGNSEVEATLYFQRIAPASLGATSRAAGDAIKDIENLCVLVYNTEGNFVTSFYGTPDDKGSFKSLVVDQRGNTDRPDDNNTSAEGETPKASLRFDIENGIYRVYAVANMGDVANNTAYNVTTEEQLKNIKLQWINNATDADGKYSVAKNNQMFGYFSTDGSAQGFNAPDVTVNRKMNLFCWLRRAASKVTVAFDGTNLEEGVRVHLKSIRIKHIPRTCYLGKENTPGYVEYGGEKDNTATVESALYEDGEVYYYSGKPDDDEANFANWPRISLGKATYGLLPPGEEEDERLPIAGYHTEYTPALYFYENLQGEGNKDKADFWDGKNLKDKRQDANGDNQLDAPGLPKDEDNNSQIIVKDDVEFGTYIEVEAHYDARMSKRPSEGKIIYRFMLGKDVYQNYNAERNYHYKLTLKFNGYANDVDWHIEYREEKEMIAPDPYYISYLYDQKAVLPIRLKGTQYADAKLKAEIIENDWFPYGAKQGVAGENGVYWAGTIQNDGIWHGFLSLSETKDKIIGDGKNYEKDATWNKDYFMDSSRKKAVREYDDLTVGSHPNAEFGDYAVETSDEGLVVQLPFYTRAKQMVPTTGYTGNNPYVAYRRKAVVRLSLLDKTTGNHLKDKDGKDIVQDITVWQVRRCVNPKGVWRSWDNTDGFHVVMRILESEESKKFIAYDSDGPWRAKVEIDPTNLVTLREASKEDGYVHGHTDSHMDFHIDFNGTCTDKEQVRCAIVLVEYNNYTCHHRIFVRQGYAPLTLNDEGIKWHTCNMYSKTEETLSPLEEGSFFKFNNWDDAVLASNNEQFGFKVVPGEAALTLANGSKKWSDIHANTKPKNEDGMQVISFPETTVSNTIGYDKPVTVRVATMADYKSLRNAEEREFGYGVLYGDGATETLEDVDEVYGYVRGGDSKRGMRGCFVYNAKNGNNLFFPIGSKGYGRRKSTMEWYGFKTGSENGALQYAWRSELYKDTAQLGYRPLFYDVYRREGAIYWFRDITWKVSSQKNDSTGVTSYTYTFQNDDKSFLDLNYFTFDFELGGEEAVSPLNKYNESSGAFIRCVEEVK